jgi:NLI interacting factor-like phosphatase
MDFKVWLEATSKKYIFLDLDNTLLHKIELGWIKDTPENANYAPLLISGQHPYPEIKTIHTRGRTYHIFPRPRLAEFLETVSTIAELYVLTHSDNNFCDQVFKKYNLEHYINGCFSTGDQEPYSVAKTLNLPNQEWILIDNMKITSIEIINKMRILGLVFPEEHNAHAEGTKIVKEARKHFIQVKDWYPHIDEHADNELFRIMPEIREKLGFSN